MGRRSAGRPGRTADLEVGRLTRYLLLAAAAVTLVVVVGLLLVVFGSRSPSVKGHCDAASYELHAKTTDGRIRAMLDITAKKGQEWSVRVTGDGRRIVEYTTVTDPKGRLDVLAMLDADGKKGTKTVVEATFGRTGAEQCTAELTVDGSAR